MKILMAATGDFALPTLACLTSGGHDLLALITQPDRPAGRGRRVRPARIKQAALHCRVPVLQPERIAAAETVALVADLAPEVLLVIAYGQKIPEEICKLPPKGAINLHGSLLPELRGAAPCNWAIVNGLKRSGASVMYLAPKMDTGGVLGQREVAIGPRETAGQLHDRLATVGARLVLEVLDQIEAGTLKPTPQDESRATLAPRLSKADGAIDWRRPAGQLDCFVRGMSPWPGAFTYLKQSGRPDLRVIVEEALPLEDVAGELKKLGELGELREESDPGTVLETGRRLVVAAGRGAVDIAAVKPESARRMTAQAFCNGHAVQIGDRLGLPSGERAV